MADLKELQAEQAYTRRVQQMLLTLIEQSQEISGSHQESIRMILADAWEELRVRPTAISPEEMQQLAGEVDRFTARRRFAEEMAERSRRMLHEPFFARVDFVEEGEEEIEKIVIGLYSLPDEQGNLLVCDWRAPICSLYYDALPGDVSYRSPSGEIRGRMTLKRQYRMERGVLKYYVDTQLNIDDHVLLDILSGATSRHMQQIVSTIQSEQNAAIRSDDAAVVSVVGSAGSGKTSVAMHRAAYLMYRRRDVLDASRIQILSPSTAFSEYISTVLPELGEDNIRARTLSEMVEQILSRRVESPVEQLNRLMASGSDLRHKSVSAKGGRNWWQALEACARRFADDGPAFGDIAFEGETLVSAEALGRMYRQEFTMLTPAQRLQRMQAALETRFAEMEARFCQQYEHGYQNRYSGRELRQMARMAAVQRMHPLRTQVAAMTELDGTALLSEAMRRAGMDEALIEALEENRRAHLTWWEDAVSEAFLRVRLGFTPPDKSVYHLLVDEAQDLPETALALLHSYLPRARVTLLGDPKQRTCPALPPCNPDNWGECFGVERAPVYHLSRCYRSTLPIARLCNAILPGGEQLVPFGREGEMPVVAEFSEGLLKETLRRFRDAGHRSIAILTRTTAQADFISARLDNVYRLDGGENDLQYEAEDNVVACYHLTKGMEFDAVIVVWPDCPLTDGERRRLYTACSRALHAAALLGGKKLIAELGIVL